MQPTLRAPVKKILHIILVICSEILPFQFSWDYLVQQLFMPEINVLCHNR